MNEPTMAIEIGSLRISDVVIQEDAPGTVNALSQIDSLRLMIEQQNQNYVDFQCRVAEDKSLSDESKSLLIASTGIQVAKKLLFEVRKELRRLRLSKLARRDTFTPQEPMRQDPAGDRASFHHDAPMRGERILDQSISQLEVLADHLLKRHNFFARLATRIESESPAPGVPISARRPVSDIA